jgi:NAD(P)-dependent dehydrogenase (short-subunit alcohol dehydrogenase family)
MLNGIESTNVLVTGAAQGGGLAVTKRFAGVFAFLASEDAAYITGQTIYAVGGLTLSADYRKNGASAFERRSKRQMTSGVRKPV